MDRKAALALAVAILDPFKESGLYEEYAYDEGFTDEQYQEMLDTLEELEAEA